MKLIGFNAFLQHTHSFSSTHSLHVKLIAFMKINWLKQKLFLEFMSSSKTIDRTKSFSLAGKFRKWEKVIEPLTKYTRKSSNFGYPLDFTFELQKLMGEGLSLKLNIPLTLSGTNDNCMRTVFANDSEEVGKIVYTANIVKSNFDQEVEKEWSERLNKVCEKDHAMRQFVSELKTSNSMEVTIPFVMVKEKSIDSLHNVDLRTMAQNKDQFKKVLNIDVNQVCQEFIIGNSKMASIVRFFYYPDKNNSIAFKIDNSDHFIKKKQIKTLWKVQEQNQQTLTFLKIMHQNKSFYTQTQQLVKFLEKNLKFDISKVVCDWVIDANNRYYLIDVKELAYSKRVDTLKQEIDVSACLSYLSCSVCLQHFNPMQMKKVLTNKIIYQFFEHLKKRQIRLSFEPTCRYSSDTRKVCDLCYMLVVSQTKLMQLQFDLAKATHSTTMQRLEDKTSAGETANKLRCELRRKQWLHEWRFFIYLEDVRELKIQNWDPTLTYYLMIRIHNSITSFRIKEPDSPHNLIKAIKIHYIFSENDQIDQFLSQTQILVRITSRNHWNAVIAEGNTSGLYEESEKHSMRKFKQILVFNKKSKYSVVGMHIGIKKEGVYNAKNLDLTKFHDAYMVNQDYSNSYSLPAEWMETIDPSYCIESTANSTFNYSFQLNQQSKKLTLPHLRPQNDKKRLVL